MLQYQNFWKHFSDFIKLCMWNNIIKECKFLLVTIKLKSPISIMLSYLQFSSLDYLQLHLEKFANNSLYLKVDRESSLIYINHNSSIKSLQNIRLILKHSFTRYSCQFQIDGLKMFHRISFQIKIEYLFLSKVISFC